MAAQGSKKASPGSVELFAIAMLSHAEKALCESSNMRAPARCWGCHGLYPGSDHCYRECPYKMELKVQQQLKVKLDEFLLQKHQKKFELTH